MKKYNNQRPISGVIQLDDAYLGGELRARGSQNKTPFVAAVSLDEQGHPINMKLNVVSGFKTAEIRTWARAHLVEGSDVILDQLACFRGVEGVGCSHLSIKCAGNLELLESKEFKWVNTMIGNVKTAFKGTYHSISARYFAELCFRFNARFDLTKLLPLLVRILVTTAPMPRKYLKYAQSYG